MSTKTTTVCDFCREEIELADGETPTQISIRPKTPANISPARDEFDICDACTTDVHANYPKLAESLRLVRPVAVPERAPEVPPALDSVSPEQLLVILAERLGVRVVANPDAPPKG